MSLNVKSNLHLKTRKGNSQNVILMGVNIFIKSLDVVKSARYQVKSYKISWHDIFINTN